MSQQTLPCTPPPRTVEGGFIFFSYKCLVLPQNVFKGKPEYFGVIHDKRPKNVFFSANSLKPNFNKVNIFR